MCLRVRVAVEADAAAVGNLWVNASRWLARRGLDQFGLRVCDAQSLQDQIAEILARSSPDMLRSLVIEVQRLLAMADDWRSVVAADRSTKIV